jgi:AcrR family transcriptional regulator
MSTPLPPSLVERRNHLSRRVILDAALALLEGGSVTELTVRAVARHAGISERTVFRYFADREVFLDAVADAMREKMDLPPPPQSVDELLDAPRALYERFEATGKLIRSALHSELFPRMREAQARARWTAVRRIVDAVAPRRPERQRKIAAANIRYYLAATTWHYYRIYFGFTLDETIESAQIAIRQCLDGLRASR